MGIVASGARLQTILLGIVDPDGLTRGCIVGCHEGLVALRPLPDGQLESQEGLHTCQKGLELGDLRLVIAGEQSEGVLSSCWCGCSHTPVYPAAPGKFQGIYPVTPDYVPNPDSNDSLEDVVYDFIEQEVGRLRFDQNWPAMKNPRDRAARWLQTYQYNFTPDQLVAGVQKVWDHKSQWKNPFVQNVRKTKLR